MKIVIPQQIETLEVKSKEKLTEHASKFKSFLTQNSIITLALGIIIGQTTKDVVNALVEGIITPLLALILSPVMQQKTLQNFEVVIGGSHFLIGKFVSTFIEMILIMFVIYITVGVLLKKMDAIGIKEVSTPEVVPVKNDQKIKTKKTQTQKAA